MAGLYIHIPFCHSKCAYCDFYSRPCRGDSDMLRQFSFAVEAEYRLRSHEYIGSCGGKFATAYIGGGTPSILPPAEFLHIVDVVRGDISTGGEFTIECNPEDVTPEMAQMWFSSGINRVSMGVQSFVDNELKAVGRRHTASEALVAIDTLRNTGFTNISIDLIYGLPQQTLESWRRSVDLLHVIKPEHFSAYALSIEPGTRLYASVQAGRFVTIDDVVIEDMYSYLCQVAREAGYEHYEISNFAMSGRRAQHNSSYWRDEAYLGLGPSAVSFDGKATRRTNRNDVSAYTRQDFSGAEIECETVVERANDAIMIGLRTSDGIDLQHLREISDNRSVERVLRSAETFVARGMLVNNSQAHLYIPERYWLVSDAIIRELMM